MHASEPTLGPSTKPWQHRSLLHLFEIEPMLQPDVRNVTKMPTFNPLISPSKKYIMPACVLTSKWFFVLFGNRVRRVRLQRQELSLHVNRLRILRL